MIGRKPLRFWQTFLLCVGATALLSGRAAFAQQIVFDRYIRIVVDDGTSQFSVFNLDGDPLTVLDDNLNAMFPDVTAVPMKTTLFVSSNLIPVTGADTGIFGGAGGDVTQIPTLFPDGRSIFSSWRFPAGSPDVEGRNLLVTQKVSLVRDLARVEYTITNQGVGRVVGLRIALDPSASSLLDPNLYEAPPGSTVHDLTSNPFFVPKQNFFSFETDFRPSYPVGIPRNLITTPIPSEFYTFAPAFNPFAFWKGVLTNANLADVTTPDRVVFAGYQPLIGATGGGIDPLLPDWGYTINPAQYILGPDPVNGDVSAALFYGPRPLNTGQRWTIVTYYGVGVASHGYAGPAQNPVFVGAAEAPFSLPLVNGITQDFQFFGFAQNLLNTASVPGMSATILPPDGLELASPTLNPTVALGTLDPFTTGNPNVERQTSWFVHPNGVRAGVLPVNLVINSPLGSASVRREVSVPQGRLYRIRQDFAMYTFPFTFDDPSPAAVLGLPSGDFQIVRWNPDANGGFGAYEPTLALVAGESYWIRLLNAPPAGFVDVILNGAAPVSIQGEGFGPGGSFASAIRRFWNQVGNPSPYAVVLKDLRLLDPQTGAVVSFNDAVARQFLLGSVWRFDRNLNTYVQLNPTDYVQPGEGIWIFGARPLVILWPAPLGFGISVG